MKWKEEGKKKPKNKTAIQNESILDISVLSIHS